MLGKLPKSRIRTPSNNKAASAKRPSRIRIARSVTMVASSGSQLAQSVSGFALGELADARVGALPECVRRAVEQDLSFTRFQPGQRIKHDHAVGDLQRGFHIVG